MKIVHTEASLGWGGQEIRILNESMGMRARGHEVFILVRPHAKLGVEAKKMGFTVLELPLTRSELIQSFFKLILLLKKHRIELINTHSSFDAWLAGIVGKMLGIPIIRTRHLSTPIRGGLNSYLLYNKFVDRVVTTCKEVVPIIQKQASLPEKKILSIPTGVDPKSLEVPSHDILEFRKRVGCSGGDLLIGTLCILRGWKGVKDFLEAAKLLENEERLKWVVVGSGPSEGYFLEIRKELQLEDRVFFTGFMPPAIPIASMDIFLLLSHSHEGVSQASLQAAWLKKPLVTTPTGGLKEVTIDGKTGFLVPPHSPNKIRDAVKILLDNETLRKSMGDSAHELVHSKFTLEKMLDEMESVYRQLKP